MKTKFFYPIICLVALFAGSMLITSCSDDTDGFNGTYEEVGESHGGDSENQHVEKHYHHLKFNDGKVKYEYYRRVTWWGADGSGERTEGRTSKSGSYKISGKTIKMSITIPHGKEASPTSTLTITDEGLRCENGAIFRKI